MESKNIRLLKVLEKSKEYEKMKNEEQRIDPRTMQPIGDEREKYLQELERERKRYEKEQQRKRDERISNIDNPIARIIKVIAWIVLGIGGIVGLIIGQQYEDEAIIVLLEVWGISGIATISLLAFAEIIQILHDIRAKIYKK